MGKHSKIVVDRRKHGFCCKCHGKFPLTELYFQPDESNHAISNNAFEFCKPCFPKQR